MSNETRGILEETKNVPNLKAFMQGAIAELKAFLPVRDEYERWSAQKAKHLAELEALRAEVEQNQNVVSQHEFVVADLKRQRARAEDELGVVQRDIARARLEFDALQKRINDFKRRNPL